MKKTSIIDCTLAEPVTISPNGNLKAAANLMRDRQAPALIVIYNKEIIGVVTERDIVNALSIHDHSTGAIRVKDAMRKTIISLSADDTVGHALHLMTKHHSRHLPVFRENTLIGMVNLNDILELVLKQRHATLALVNES